MRLFGDATPQITKGAYQIEAPVIQSRYDLCARAWSSLPVGAEITTSATPIYMLGNSKLGNDVFILRPGADWESVRGTALPPGKSASIDFWGLPNIDCVPERVLAWIIDRQFARPLRRQDNIWHTTVADIQEAGFSTLYTPHSSNPLHVRMCATQLRRLTQQEYRAYVESKAFEKSTDRLAKIWRRMPISK